MKWAILSDVHGNLEALRAVLRDLQAENPQRIAFLGDAVGYGADPNECLAILRDLTDWCVAGNHDYGAVGLTDIEAFNPAARSAILWTRQRLSAEHQAYLRRQVLLRRDGDLAFAHATPNQPEEWYYLLTFPEAEEAFQSFNEGLAFVGHSHRPMVLAKEGTREVEACPPEEVVLKPGARYIINVGSVGQPRDGHAEAAYGIYDDARRRYVLKRVPYDVQAAREKILRAGLPAFLAHRLSRGI